MENPRLLTRKQQQDRGNKPNDPFPASYYRNQKIVQEKLHKMTEMRKSIPNAR